MMMEHFHMKASGNSVTVKFILCQQAFTVLPKATVCAVIITITTTTNEY